MEKVRGFFFNWGYLDYFDCEYFGRYGLGGFCEMGDWLGFEVRRKLFGCDGEMVVVGVEPAI